MCSTLHSDACCQAIILQHEKLTFITPEIQKQNRQGVPHRNQEKSHCKEEGKDEDGAERRSQEKGKDGDEAEKGGFGSQEEGQDKDGAVVEAKKEENERMRLVGG